MEFTGDIKTSERATHDSLVRIADLLGVPTEGRKVTDTSVFHLNFLFHVFHIA